MKLQMKYNLLHILFWTSYCAIYGYIAVFLQYKGMSNSEIGIVTGVGAASTIFLSPVISSLISKIKGLTIKRLLLILYIMNAIAMLSFTFLPMPNILIIILYIMIICFMVTAVPLLSTICMDYLKVGKYINFGISRGMGSVAYAVTAVILGQLIEFFNPNACTYLFIISSIFFLIDLFSFEDIEIEQEEEVTEDISTFHLIKTYKVYFFILLGFGFMFAAQNMLAVYLINIVTKLGGSTSLYGIAVFAMAASEMPFMGIAHTLLKKHKAETLLLVAAIFYIFRNCIISLAPNIPILLIGMLFQGCSYGLFTGVITYYVNDYLKHEHQVMGQTLLAMMTTGFGSSVGSVFGGFLQDSFGLQSMLYFAIVITLIGFIIAFITIKFVKQPEKIVIE
jgi:PPP family 3-phenylpropionic acid transporter